MGAYYFDAPAPEIVPDETEADLIMTLTQRYDRLLRWLSAVGAGSWNSFRSTCEALGLDADGAQARRILRRLRLLGHVESSPDGERWSAAPPVLASTSFPGGRNGYVLCGQRDAILLAALQETANVEYVAQDQVGGHAPATVRLRAESDERIAGMPPISTGALCLAGNVALRLAEAVPPLTGWRDSLQIVEGIVPARYTFRRFVGDDFMEGPFERQSGFYELWDRGAEKPADRPTSIAFYDSGRDRWLRGDWYGLRYLAGVMDGIPSVVHYDAASGRLALLASARWPEIYERALVLASGRLPSVRGAWLIYEQISPGVLSTLQSKLQVRIEEMHPDA